MSQSENIKECPIFTCPFNSGDYLGCSLNKCAYFSESDTKSSLEKLAVVSTAFLEALHDFISNMEDKK